METLLLLLFLGCVLIAHWFADFVCQSNKVAQGKSKDFDLLLEHGFTYFITLGIPMLLVCLIVPEFRHLLNSGLIVGYVALNAVIHTFIDFFTSKASSSYWEEKDYGSFFNVIGLDQLLHMLTFLFTYKLLVL